MILCRCCAGIFYGFVVLFLGYIHRNSFKKCFHGLYGVVFIKILGYRKTRNHIGNLQEYPFKIMGFFSVKKTNSGLNLNIYSLRSFQL
ncbi:Putative membrane protein [Zobellia galactanivorans]|uniref:Putative membrane protein n=1 Tax=Zobellia galactanivorans (strain DSM 12802 / CCUG 47099 / CIP 106680 / NCIMB 13871 / Dsij) TaxID=63186 RepID=G0LA59_ZOBGA|nr:Putative membrane protein [Zobellia galactanivorans]